MRYCSLVLICKRSASDQEPFYFKHIDGMFDIITRGHVSTRHDDRDKMPMLPVRQEGNVLFNDVLNTFYLRLYGVRHMVKDHSDS